MHYIEQSDYRWPRMTVKVISTIRNFTVASPISWWTLKGSGLVSDSRCIVYSVACDRAGYYQTILTITGLSALMLAIPDEVHNTLWHRIIYLVASNFCEVLGTHSRKPADYLLVEIWNGTRSESMVLQCAPVKLRENAADALPHNTF